jgi:hypothetical protein
MPRYRRQIAIGSVQHIISRFVNRELRFDADPPSSPANQDARREYLRRAGNVLYRSDWRALGFALMGSHVHWAMQAGMQSSASVIKPLHTGFATWLNATQDRLGPVFADRHRSLTFEGESASLLLAYIHNNPVRAGVVSDPVESSWTSHRAYLGLCPAPPWLNVKLGLHLCGFSSTPSGRLQFHEMVMARSADARRVELSGGDMQHRRRTMRSAMRGPVELASPKVTPEGDDVRVHAPAAALAGCCVRPAWRGEANTLLCAAARATDTTVSELQSLSRRRHITNARRVALVAWARELHRPTIELARALGLSGSSAAELIASAPPAIRIAARSLAISLRDDDQEG